MISLLRCLGFPAPERRDAVRFHFAKNLPYNTRAYLTLALLFTGIVLQIVFLNPWVGLPFIVVGIGLVIVKGYDSRVRLKYFTPDPNWTEVPVKKIAELERLRKRTKKWDRDALDISNALGVLSLIGLTALVVFLSLFLGGLADESGVAMILLMDGAVLMIPLWLTGMKFILKQPNLTIRIKIILKMVEVFNKIKMNGETFKPSLMLARGEGSKTVPVDTRFSVSYPVMPKGFYGLQAQININVVQGQSYPYFYCVLAAKPGFGLASYRKKIPLRKKIICEYQTDRQAEVLVIRQKTTRKSGYHTKDKKCAEIFQVALEGGRTIGRQAET